jgi:hypothetical protein
LALSDASAFLIAFVEFMLALSFLASLFIVSGGLICLWRDARRAAGQADPFAVAANGVPSEGILARLGLRPLQGSRLRPGDIVQVLPLKEIQATLDGNGAVDSLPFMPEMEAYCGKLFRVHRRVDKIHDMRYKTGHRLRRMQDTVTLTEVRCSGCQHGGCQAECQILWKDKWLRKVPGRPGLSAARLHAEIPPVAVGYPESVETGQTYVCQMTELWDASSPMGAFDFRQDLRPLFSGNIGIGAFLLAVLTGIFNRVQALRGGLRYPYLPEAAIQGQTPVENLGLTAGDVVVVRSVEEIARTLVHSRNRGLWFDAEMIRFCGQVFVVHRRVSHVIHEATGKMVVMKTPSVVLENVTATGEFLRFGPQHEYIFWREIWLRRAGKEAANVAASGS